MYATQTETPITKTAALRIIGLPATFVERIREMDNTAIQVTYLVSVDEDEQVIRCSTFISKSAFEHDAIFIATHKAKFAGN